MTPGHLSGEVGGIIDPALPAIESLALWGSHSQTPNDLYPTTQGAVVTGVVGERKNKDRTPGRTVA